MVFLILAVALMPAFARPSEHAPVGPSGADALRQLLEGNERFVAGRLAACGKTTPELRQKLATGQAPRAIIISCSDSRLPPELVFDEEPGQKTDREVVVGLHSDPRIRSTVTSPPATSAPRWTA